MQIAMPTETHTDFLVLIYRCPSSEHFLSRLNTLSSSRSGCSIFSKALPTGFNPRYTPSLGFELSNPVSDGYLVLLHVMDISLLLLSLLSFLVWFYIYASLTSLHLCINCIASPRWLTSLHPTACINYSSFVVTCTHHSRRILPPLYSVTPLTSFQEILSVSCSSSLRVCSASVPSSPLSVCSFDQKMSPEGETYSKCSQGA